MFFGSAWVLLPSVWVHPSFGKLLFVVADVVLGALLVQLLRASTPPGTPDRRIAQLVAVFLLCPLTVGVSTRGSADVIVCTVVVASLRCLCRRQMIAAGLLHGAAVHLKLYPVVHIVPAALFALHGPRRLQPQEAAAGPQWAAALQYTAATVVGAAVPTLLCTHLYGWEFLRHTYLYHFTRVDFRHNFAPWFLPTYLSLSPAGTTVAAGTGAAAVAASTLRWLATLPQLAATFGVGVAFYRDPPFCVFLQTLVFVAFNRVSTAQYFVWYVGGGRWCGGGTGASDHTPQHPPLRRYWALAPLAVARCGAPVKSACLWMTVEVRAHARLFVCVASFRTLPSLRMCARCAFRAVGVARGRVLPGVSRLARVCVVVGRQRALLFGARVPGVALDAAVPRSSSHRTRHQHHQDGLTSALGYDVTIMSKSAPMRTSLSPCGPTLDPRVVHRCSGARRAANMRTSRWPPRVVARLTGENIKRVCERRDVSARTVWVGTSMSLQRMSSSVKCGKPDLRNASSNSATPVSVIWTPMRLRECNVAPHPAARPGSSTRKPSVANGLVLMDRWRRCGKCPSCNAVDSSLADGKPSVLPFSTSSDTSCRAGDRSTAASGLNPASPSFNPDKFRDNTGAAPCFA